MEPVDFLIQPKPRDVGFPVRRLLPAAAARSVGPFVFLDHMGPARFEPASAAGDVLAHPHIGLATVTYLFSGAMVHRDSLGVVQRIEPGDVNWMTAGR
ncbi:MAG: pirin family protein, partial [Burkholderiales bacterium]